MGLVRTFSILFPTIAALSIPLGAQELPDTVLLKAVEIRETLPPGLMGVREGRIDSLSLQLNQSADISRVLQTSQGLAIKTYGPGSVKTVSIRGNSSSHTKVTWNGIPVNSPTLGLTDLSNLPVIIADDVELRYGGASTGSIGGEINLSTSLLNITNDVLSAYQEFSSLAASSTGIKAKVNRGPYSAAMRMYRLSSRNEYFYHDNSVSGPPFPIEKRRNANIFSLGGVFELAYSPDSKTSWRSGVWYHSSFRLIPSSLLMVELDSNERQSDYSTRAYLGFRRVLGKGVLDGNLGTLKEQMNYSQKMAGISSHFETKGLVQNLKYTVDINARHRIRVEQDYEHYRGYSAAYYSLDPTRNILSLSAAAFGMLIPRLGYFLILRTSLFNGKFLPATPSLGLHYTLFRDVPLEMNANISRVHRVPTLNDLYWFPGGDPGLDAESGLQSEIGLKYKQLHGKTYVSWDANVFSGLVDGWIQWLPHPEYNYWTARNLRQVRSKGFETSLSIDNATALWSYRLKANYSFTKSSPSKAAFEGDGSVGKQLIYTPMHTASVAFWLQRKSIFTYVNSPFSGKRYTNSDNTRYLPAFALVDVGLGIRGKIKHNIIEARIDINNILNSDYQVIAWYPMPLRYYALSINLTLDEQ